MLLKFKNEHIASVLLPIWDDPSLDYDFQTQINDLLEANGDNNFVQDVEISKEMLTKLYKSASQQPEGVAAARNKAMKEALLPQLMAISNLQDVIDNDAVPNEAASTILAIQAMDAEDIAAAQTLIQKGKNKILKLS